MSLCRRPDLDLFTQLLRGRRRHWAECSAADRFLNALVRNRQVALAERRTVPVQPRVLERFRVEFVAPCIRHGNIPPARRERALECPVGLVLERRVLESARRRAWPLRPALAIVRRVATPSGAAETTATKSRRKAR